MAQLEQLAPNTATGTLFEEVQQFYSRQMRLLDDGNVAEWAATFTVDGVFAANAHPAPAKGRQAIEAAAQEAARRLAAEGIQHRHWLGMLHVEKRNDGTVVAHTYALIIRTPRGGPTTVQLSCTCEDVLVREDEQLLIRDRQVSRDDLGPGPKPPRG